MDYHPASWGKKKTNEMYRPELASPLQYQQVCSCLTPGADVGFGGEGPGGECAKGQTKHHVPPQGSCPSLRRRVNL